jgi:hypothetical protein
MFIGYALLNLLILLVLYIYFIIILYEKVTGKVKSYLNRDHIRKKRNYNMNM